MGCDIHISIEYKYPSLTGISSYFNLVSDFYASRNYRLFGIFAGVRYNTSYVVSLPRGLPQDISDCTKRQLFCSDYHSHSHLNFNELLEARRYYILDALENQDFSNGSNSDVELLIYKSILQNVDDDEKLLYHDFGEFECLCLNSLIGCMLPYHKRNYDTRIVFAFDS